MSELLESGGLRYNKSQKYVLWDLETCHLNTISDNLPWQLGYVTATRDEILEGHSVYIKWPNLKISKDAARITRYDENVVNAQGIDPLEALNALDKLLYNEDIRPVFFNGFNFDYAVHNIWRNKLGFKTDYSYLKRCIDVRALIVANKLGIPLKDSDNFYFWQLKMLTYHQRGFKSNLTLSCKELGIEIDESKTHDGVYDCYLTYYVLKEMLKKFNIQ